MKNLKNLCFKFFRFFVVLIFAVTEFKMALKT